MTVDHIAAALDLCREAGWNQTYEDWHRLLSYEPNGCFAATLGDQLVGTVTTTRYGRELAWIGMMLVHPQYRRQGIATALMRQSIDYLFELRVPCIKLDATPGGEQVYGKLGFVREWTFHRWTLERNTSSSQFEVTETTMLEDQLLQLDRTAFGADRSEFLELLRRDSLVRSTANGFGMLRRGFLASYLGPISAVNSAAAAAIVADLCNQSCGSVFWDIPSPNSGAVQLARSLGFSPIRSLTRMRLGEDVVTPNVDMQFALSDPGTG